MSEFSAQDVENAEFIAEETGQTVEVIESLAEQYAADNGDTASEELEDGAEGIAIAEMSALLNGDDAWDDDDL